MGARRTASSEARAPVELARLLASPVYQGAGVPRGDGRAVLCLPGLFGNDLYLTPLHGWLLRIGYRPLISRIPFNAGCPNDLLAGARAELQRQLASGRQAAIIGHSRGGILGWSLAVDAGAKISHLVLLGSPAGAVASLARRGRLDLRSAPAMHEVARAGDLARRLLSPRCAFPDCGCAYASALARPLDRATRVTSIFAPDDPVVPAASCELAGATNVQVQGSHSGLANNVEAYRAIASALADR